MGPALRIIGLSLLTGLLGAGLARILFKEYSDFVIAGLLFACAGGIIGAVAGAAEEIVAAQRRKLSS